MPLGDDYNIGTITVVSGSTAVAGTGVTWSDIVEGDWIFRTDGTFGFGLVASVNGTLDGITLKFGWNGVNGTHVTYDIVKASFSRYDPAITQDTSRQVLQLISSASIIIQVPPGSSAPDPGLGSDGVFAVRVSTSPFALTWWEKISGVWVSQGTLSSVASDITATSARVIATAPITLSGLQTIDGVSLAAGDRVLVNGQASAATNGIYQVASGAWSYAPEFSTTVLTKGFQVRVTEGTVYAHSVWWLETANPVVLGVSAISFGSALNVGSLALNGTFAVNDVLTVAPPTGLRAGQPVHGLLVSQTGGASTISGSFNWNRILVIDAGSNTTFGGTLDEFGLLAASSALRVDMRITGAGDIKIPILGAAALEFAGSGVSEPVGVAGTVYANVASPNSLLYGMNAFAGLGKNAVVNTIIALDAEMQMASGAVFANRFGVRAITGGAATATGLDAAYVIQGGDPGTASDAGTGSVYTPLAPWINAFAFAVPDPSGHPPLAATGNVFFSSGAFTTANFVNLPNVTFTGHYISLPKWAVHGDGTAVFGAGAASLPTAPQVMLITAASAGQNQIFASTNAANGVNGFQANDSQGHNAITLVAWEATAGGTVFGLSRNNCAALLAQLSSNAGLLIGTVPSSPLYLATNNTVWLTLSSAGFFTFAGPITETINQNGATGITINNNSSGTAALTALLLNNGTNLGAFGLGGLNYNVNSALQNRTYVYNSAGGMTLYNAGNDPIGIYVAGTAMAAFGNGRAVIGAGAASLPSSPEILRIQCPSGGQIQLFASTDGAANYDGVQINSSNGLNSLVGVIWEPSNTGTFFGQNPVGNWASLFADGTANLGMLFGTRKPVPLLIGTNDTVWLTLSGAGLSTFVGPVTLTINQNATTSITINNNSGGASSLTQHTLSNGTASAAIGLGGTGYTGVVGLQNRTYIVNNGGAGIAIFNVQANPILFYINGAEVGRWDGTTAGQLDLGVVGSTVGKLAFANATSGSIVIQPITGALGSSVITAPAITGTMTVLGNTTTGSGSTLVLATAPTFVTSITAPLLIGGAAAGSTLTLNGTSNGSPSNAYLILQSNGQFVGINNAAPKTFLDVNANSASPALVESASLARFVAADAANGGVEMTAYGTGTRTVLSGGMAGGTAAAPTATPNNSVLMDLRGRGYNSGWQFSASIIISSAEAWSSGHQGTVMQFFTTPNGSTTIGQAAALQPSGGLVVASGLTNDPGAGGIYFSGQLYGSAIATTASAANAFIDTTTTPAGQLKRSTSSMAYKKDAEPLDLTIARKVLRDANPIWYRSTCPGDNPEWSWYGLGAEDVAEKLDPRLAMFGYRDDDYEEYEVVETTLSGEEGVVSQRRLKADAVPRPDGVHYTAFIPVLLSGWQMHDDTIIDHERRLSALEARAPAT